VQLNCDHDPNSHSLFEINELVLIYSLKIQRCVGKKVEEVKEFLTLREFCAGVVYLCKKYIFIVKEKVFLPIPGNMESKA
jgi:hypothetical protein